MKRELVYDWPMRVFHWFFVLFFLTAFIIAKTVDSETVNFTYHMLAGLSLGFAVLLRWIWAFIGTRHARLRNFALKPHELMSYFKGILTRDQKRWAGHNPASSWSALLMVFLALTLATTGYLMTTGNDKELFEDYHEIAANSFMIVVVLHVLGVAVHSLRHKEWLPLAMLDGKKEGVSSEQSIPSSKPFFGFVFLALLLLFVSVLSKSYNSETRALKLFGVTLQLGEVEEK